MLIFLARTLIVALLLTCIGAAGCAKEKPKTKLIYFGFDDRSEKPEDVLRFAKTWGNSPPCSHWRAAIIKENTDYQVLFGTAETITVIDRRGEVLYSGGIGPLYMPHGNPDGSGVNLCKLTGE